MGQTIKCNGRGCKTCNMLLQVPKVTVGEEFDQNSDLYQLGLHLHFEHGFVEPQALDRNIRFGLLEIVNPNEIDKKEYKYMHKLNTFQRRIPSTGVISDGFETFEYIFPRPMNGLT